MKRYLVIGVLALAVTAGLACGEPSPDPWTPISPGLDIEVVRNVDYIEDVDYEDDKDKLDFFLPKDREDFPV